LHPPPVDVRIAPRRGLRPGEDAHDPFRPYRSPTGFRHEERLDPMAGYEQKKRPLQINFKAVKEDTLLIESFSGKERLSGLFEFQLGLLVEAPKAESVKFDDILGLGVTVTFETRTGSARYYNGIVSQISQGLQIFSKKGSVDFIRYRAIMVPKLWLLTRTVRSRIFQEMDVIQILEKVLHGMDLDHSKIHSKFDPRPYCVQYRETDFAFASRLMEEEGIYYYFDHQKDSHKLVLVNSTGAHTRIPGDQRIEFRQTSKDIEEEHSVFSWEKTQEVRAGKYTLWDQCFQKEAKDHFEATQTVSESVQVGKESLKLKVAENDSLEVYDYPGGYAKRYDEIKSSGEKDGAAIGKISGDGDRTVKLRMEEETVAGLRIRGKGNCSRFAPGLTFALSRHFAKADGEYLLTSVEHRMSQEAVFGATEGSSSAYTNDFECIPSGLQYRPPRDTPRPLIHGSQTALVVGTTGKEIDPDKYARVKVQFPWDRDGKYDTKSSCWIRVATPWAGKSWGMIHIPRIGHEVVVDFLEGDPDRPIIVGSVYNHENPIPYVNSDKTIPTQSGTKSRSSEKGEATNFNELRFEDNKGKEEVYFHAERDFNRVVENNDTLKVGSDDSKTCPDGSQTITIYKNRKTTIQTGDETLDVDKGNRTVTIKEKNEKLEVSKGKRDVIVEQDDTHQVRSGSCIIKVDTKDYQLTVSKGKMTCQAAQSIELKCGGSTLTMKPDSIELKIGGSSIKMEPTKIALVTGGTSINMDPKSLEAEALTVSVQGRTACRVQGANVMIQANAAVSVQGAIIKLN
jgi:type VI secretion system secreted protein VgrG